MSDMMSSIAKRVKSSVFKVKIGTPEDTDQIMSSLGFPFNKMINQKNFPLVISDGPREEEIEIFNPCVTFDKEEGLKILKDNGLLPPSYEHGLRFARQYGKATISEKKPFIVFLHEPWKDPLRNNRVLCINRYPGDRELILDYSDFKFHEGSVLAGVRPRKPSVS